MLRTVAHRRDSPQLRALLIKKVERRNVQFEELRHLAQGTMQRIAEVERFRQRLGDRIQHQEFAVAPPYFMLRLLPLGDVENKSLIRGDIPRRIPHGDRRLQHHANFTVLAPHFKFKIGHRTVLVEQLLQPLAVRLVAIERARNVDRHQFFARLIAGHAEKRLVEIEKTSLRRGNKHALLYARNEGPVFLFRALPVGDVL